jgi:hypothetical protein
VAGIIRSSFLRILQTVVLSFDANPDGKKAKEVCAVTLSDTDELRAFFKDRDAYCPHWDRKWSSMSLPSIAGISLVP